MRAGIENSRDTIAKCEPTPPVLQTMPASFERIGPSVVVPASSTITILPAAPSFQRFITSWIEVTSRSSPWADRFRVILPVPMTFIG